jgi:hypothetical protein
MLLPCRVALLATCLFASVSLADGQTLVEYGHLTAPSRSVAALREVKDRLTPKPPPRPAPSQSRYSDLLAVARTEWGPASTPAAAEVVAPATVSAPVVLERPADPPSFDLAEAGLEPGMNVEEVSKILGDPSIRTRGLAGRGYDEKVLYQLPTGWRIMVFAARGRAQHFQPSWMGADSPETFLSSEASVIR